MNWKTLLGAGVFAVLLFGGYRIALIAGSISMPSSEEEVAALRVKAAAQREDRIYRPPPSPREALRPDPSKNVYFGDLHVHTSISADAYLFGNRFGLDSAYAFAKGEALELRTGEIAQLTRPLDFVALTDHAEAFGRIEACADGGFGPGAEEGCAFLETPSVWGFLQMRGRAEQRPVRRKLDVFNDDPAVERVYAARTWQAVREAAQRHYEPGVFTTFVGYEYSPALPDRGKHHRNVIFRTDAAPEYAVSAVDAASEIDLWKQLGAQCSGSCEFLTIPHNPNKSWGLAFASETIDGIPYTQDDWFLRRRLEPLVEMFQIKGSSECAFGFGATDEECGFEQFFPPCEDGQETSCIHPTSMARDGLKKGLVLKQSLGANPLEFGFVGSTDTHNSNPGDTEEWDWRGTTTFTSSPATQRMNVSNVTGIRNNNPGGLAAIWAEENSREALFDAMTRKEVYATSGTRIKLRVFAGFSFPEDLGETADLAVAYARGVPMGGTLGTEANAPSLFIWATQDPDHAPLDRVQVIKGWLEDGQAMEAVYDVACAGGQPDSVSGQCPPSTAKVDLEDCSWDQSTGSPELRALWVDPSYDAEQDAFYYARVVQNPTCRWTTYDSIRLNRSPPEEVPPVVSEMAWSSPIWLHAP